MMYHTYIIYSEALDSYYYTGHCQDLVERFHRFNNGNGSTFTKKARDWELKWTETFESRPAAVQQEMDIKGKKSGKYIKWLISKEITD